MSSRSNGIARSGANRICQASVEHAGETEVLLGEHRADIYAFGLILYDLLTGKTRRGKGRTAFEEAARRTKKPLPPLAE